MIFRIVLLLGVTLVAASCAATDELPFLMEIAESGKAQEEMLDAETLQFNKAVQALKTHQLTVGMSMETVKAAAGEPVVVKEAGDGSVFVYKAGRASWFGGEKVYLYFDGDEKLTRWSQTGAA